jgi:hypothetical protein
LRRGLGRAVLLTGKLIPPALLRERPSTLSEKLSKHRDIAVFVQPVSGLKASAAFTDCGKTQSKLAL